MTISKRPTNRDVFDRALALRDSGEHAEACRLLDELIERVDADDTRLLAHAHLQLGHLRRQQHLDEAERHFRSAAEAEPRLELASLALFTALAARGQYAEALLEAIRLLSHRESVGYRELFAGDAYRDDLPPHELELATQVRCALEDHRTVQQSRVSPVKGDTVRVRREAPPPLRPGSLAQLRANPNGASSDELLEVRFSDGETAEVPLVLIDHRDI